MQQRSIEVILDACCAAIAEGVAERKVEKAANDEKNEDNKRARSSSALRSLKLKRLNSC